MIESMWMLGIVLASYLVVSTEASPCLHHPYGYRTPTEIVDLHMGAFLTNVLALSPVDTARICPHCKVALSHTWMNRYDDDRGIVGRRLFYQQAIFFDEGFFTKSFLGVRQLRSWSPLPTMKVIESQAVWYGYNLTFTYYHNLTSGLEYVHILDRMHRYGHFYLSVDRTHPELTRYRLYWTNQHQNVVDMCQRDGYCSFDVTQVRPVPLEEGQPPLVTQMDLWHVKKQGLWLTYTEKQTISMPGFVYAITGTLLLTEDPPYELFTSKNFVIAFVIACMINNIF